MQLDREVFARGRLIAKPFGKIPEPTIFTGIHRLGLDKKRDGLIYIPSGYDPKKPTAMAVMLHGAGGDAEHGISLIRHLADEGNVILLAPISRGVSWDIISSDSF